MMMIIPDVCNRRHLEIYDHSVRLSILRKKGPDGQNFSYAYAFMRCVSERKADQGGRLYNALKIYKF